ncbi:ABC transporter permease [Streptomyces sp. MT29]|nr:ABC transporter permease [Streptomyces sp. MT29]
MVSAISAPTARGSPPPSRCQLIHVDEVVIEGDYDRYLVRPVPPLVQLLTRRVRLSSLGDLAGGVVLRGLSTGDRVDGPGGGTRRTGWLAWGAPGIGVVLMYAAYRFWERQSRHYESSGH